MRFYKVHYILFLTVAVFLSSCSSKSYREILSSSDLHKYAIELPTSELTKREQIMKRKKCRDRGEYEKYIEKFGMHDERQLRVNFHFMNTTDSTQNFTGKEAKSWVSSLLKNANKRLRENHKMNLPIGNDTPSFNPGYQYVLAGGENGEDGIYFHYDDVLYSFLNKGKNRNNYSTRVIKKYSINQDSIANIFLMPPQRDSVLSKTFRPPTSGIALGNCVKISARLDNKPQAWTLATLLNHEFGHLLGLQHSWNSDGCDDTPDNPNCWSGNGAPPCDGVQSNNLMDYNGSQMAISPCQIATVKRTIAKIDSKKRALFIPDWCDYDDEYYIEINESQEWLASADINKGILILKNASLTIGCRISLAKGASITVESGAKLILDGCRLHNACGDNWSGIHILKGGEIEYRGEVLIEDVGGKD